MPPPGQSVSPCSRMTWLRVMSISTLRSAIRQAGQTSALIRNGRSSSRMRHHNGEKCNSLPPAELLTRDRMWCSPLHAPMAQPERRPLSGTPKPATMMARQPRIRISRPVPEHCDGRVAKEAIARCAYPHSAIRSPNPTKPSRFVSEMPMALRLETAAPQWRPSATLPISAVLLSHKASTAGVKMPIPYR